MVNIKLIYFLDLVLVFFRKLFLLPFDFLFLLLAALFEESLSDSTAESLGCGALGRRRCVVLVGVIGPVFFVDEALLVAPRGRFFAFFLLFGLEPRATF